MDTMLQWFIAFNHSLFLLHEKIFISIWYVENQPNVLCFKSTKPISGGEKHFSATLSVFHFVEWIDGIEVVHFLPCGLSSATTDARQHDWRRVPQRAARPVAAAPGGAGKAAAEEGQQPGGGEEHAHERHGRLQDEDREHPERPGGEDQRAGERFK